MSARSLLELLFGLSIGVSSSKYNPQYIFYQSKKETSLKVKKFIELDWQFHAFWHSSADYYDFEGVIK